MELYITLAILSVVLSLTIAIQIYIADKQERYRYFVLVMVAAAVWAFFSIFWLLLKPPMVFIAYKISFLGIISVPVLLFLTSLEYARSSYLRRKHFCTYLWIIPIISVLMIATNEWHGLFWKDIHPAGSYDGVTMYQYVPGSVYWLHTAYSYLLIIGALLIMFYSMLRRKQLWLFFFILAGIMVPVVANVLIVAGFTQIDYTPIMLSFAGVGFGWTISVGFYTENIKTLEQLQQRTNHLNSLYNLVVRTSEKLIKAEFDNIDQSIGEALKALGTFNEVDRAYVFEYDPSRDEINNTYEWCNEAISPEINNLQHIPYSSISSWKISFSNNEHVYIESVEDLTGEDRQQEKAILEAQGIQSLIVTPMFFGGVFVGFLGFDSVTAKKSWDANVVSLLRMAGNIIGGSIVRMRFEKVLIAEKHKAEAANRAKSEFLANMSHEIRTPLNAILGFSRIAADDTQEKETREHLEIVLSSGNSLMRLINDILDFSKIEAGMLKLHPTEIQLKTVLQFVKQTFATQAQQKNLELIIDLSNITDKYFILDESRLRQVLFNLVGNAVKFTDHGKVEVRVEATPANNANNTWQIIIEVIDTGIGISEEDQQAIFHIFNQLSRGDGRKYEGTGLGLNISRRLIELMNGHIEVNSIVGQGSTFRVVLPEVQHNETS